jgi:ComF family protein
MRGYAGILSSLRAATGGILDLVYPRSCTCCSAPAPEGGRYLCWDCMATLPFIQDPYCSICGDPFDGAITHDFVCGWCEANQPAFEIARSALRYRGHVAHLLQSFKYQHATYLAADLGMILAGCVRAHLLTGGLDAIAYVPLHPRKARSRSYNQARLLAEYLSRDLEIPVERNALRRVRWTSTQTRLRAEARRQNVEGAFVTPIPDWVQGRRWLLVDDVMTTGATVAACAKVLCDAGATRVVVATLARG